MPMPAMLVWEPPKCTLSKFTLTPLWLLPLWPLVPPPRLRLKSDRTANSVGCVSLACGFNRDGSV